MTPTLVAAARRGDRGALDSSYTSTSIESVHCAVGSWPTTADTTTPHRRHCCAICRGITPLRRTLCGVSTWLYRVTTNACLDELRPQRTAPTRDGPRRDARGRGRRPFCRRHREPARDQRRPCPTQPRFSALPSYCATFVSSATTRSPEVLAIPPCTVPIAHRSGPGSTRPVRRRARQRGNQLTCLRSS